MPSALANPPTAKSLSSLYDRPLPYTLEAEMALIGALLLDPRVAAEVSVVAAEDFYSEAHGAIWRAVLSCYEVEPEADLVQVVDWLRDHGELEAVGGMDYLSKLANETPSAAGAMRYARQVLEKSKLRKLIEVCDRTVYDALHVGEAGGVEAVVDAAESAIFEVAHEGGQADGLTSLEAVLAAEIERIGRGEAIHKGGVSTGLKDVDAVLQGLMPGDLIILAARPSMGKTALGVQMAAAIAERGGGCCLFSLEMKQPELVGRLLASRAGVDGRLLRSGLVDAQMYERVVAAGAQIERWPLHIDDRGGVTLMQLRARARRMAQRLEREGGLKAVVVDYLQLLTAPGHENRQNEVAAISRGLKALAKELNVPVVVLSQLNRAAESREGHRPRMSDLRDSGSIEQDADVVLLLHREDYYHQDAQWRADHPEKVNTAELIVAKQRNGPTDTVHLVWAPGECRFKDRAVEW